MSQLQALNALLSQAERARDTTLSTHFNAVNRLQALQQQSHQLMQYRQEYEQRWSQEFKSQSGIEILRYYQSFMQRMNQALSQQERAQTQAEQDLQALQTELMSCEMKVASIKKLIERKMNEYARQVERQEQKITDEIAARSLPMAQTNPLNSMNSRGIT